MSGNVFEFNLFAVVGAVNRHLFGIAVQHKLLLNPVVKTVVANVRLAVARIDTLGLLDF